MASVPRPANLTRHTDEVAYADDPEEYRQLEAWSKGFENLFKLLNACPLWVELAI